MTNRLLGLLAGLAVVVVLSASPGLAQTSDEIGDLRREIEALKEAQKTIQRELREIRNLLRRRRAAPTPEPSRSVALRVDGEPFKGDKNAAVTLVEFSDYQCPFCAIHVRDTLPQLERDYIKTGKVKYVLRDFPIEPLHPQAVKAAEAAYCAGDQGQYWEMHDRLFANQQALGPAELPKYAQALGLDVASFQQCLDAGRHAARVRQNLEDGLKAGVTATPTFMLGRTEPDGSAIKAVRTIVGAQAYPQFKEAIESLLSDSPQQ